jgi:hypothetical protein
MGWIRHHGIVVTGDTDNDRLAKAHKLAKSIFPEIVPGTVNCSGSFLIPPDGSKEGWAHSDEGDARRDLFVKGMADNRCSWIEYDHDIDNATARIVRSSSDPTSGAANGDT